ncbi:MAG: tRNA (adenosine(37)-N6)-threonylcarbamoyltransferase complex dimerization subunit type 1 TsaB [Chloroflexi bacterium]|nr:tRNA (adenosine(37)-N6)-threonylcarbamoyltransferase complex dimerization subunit type 1 TsaB [Chloroflexota bacterium]
MELSIDTSTRYASVALSREGSALVEITWRSERNHSVELVPAIREILRRANTKTSELSSIFIARGPGGFSALRVGISTAKTMVVSLGIPLVSVGTLDAEARPYTNVGRRVCAIINAGRDRLYVGWFDAASSLERPQYEVLTNEEFLGKIDGDTLLCGEEATAMAESIRERHGEHAFISAMQPPTRRAGTIADLGYSRLQSGERDDPITLEPLYLRSSQVDTANRTWSKARGS